MTAFSTSLYSSDASSKGGQPSNRRFGLRQLHCVVVLLFVTCGAGAQSSSAGPSYARAEALIRAHQLDDGLAILLPLLKSAAPTPKVLNLAGLAFLGKGDPKQAAQYFESALNLDAAFTPALKNLAIEEVGQGEIEAAKRHLLSAFQNSPDDLVVNLYLGEIFFQQQDFKHAAEHLLRAPALVARDPNVQTSLAVSELNIGNKQDALGAIDSLDTTTLNQCSMLLLGVALAKAELCDRAIPYLLRASTASPSSTDIRYDLAICYLSVKQYPDAAGVLQALVDGGHETAEIDNTLAEALEGDHKTQAAVDALRRAIALSPDDDSNYLDFASLCLDHEDFENAAKVLSVGLTMHPKSSRLIFERGILNAMQDHFESAEKDFQLSADLAPESDSGYIGLGVTYLETGKAAQAVPVMRSRLREHPDDANLNYLLAEALLRSGAQQGEPAYTEAQTSLQHSIQLNPNLTEPHVLLGTIYLRQEDLQHAVEQLESARRLDPNSKAARAHLAVAYRKLGQADKAKEVLIELKDINDRERDGSRESVKTPTANSPKAGTPPQQH